MDLSLTAAPEIIQFPTTKLEANVSPDHPDPGFGFSPFPGLVPQPIINQPMMPIAPGMMGGVGQYLQPMINRINQHYQQEQVQPFVQEVTSLANERFPDAFGGGLGGLRPPLLDVAFARPMPAGDIFSGISGSALSLLQAR